MALPVYQTRPPISTRFKTRNVRDHNTVDACPQMIAAWARREIILAQLNLLRVKMCVDNKAFGEIYCS